MAAKPRPLEYFNEFFNESGDSLSSHAHLWFSNAPPTHEVWVIVKVNHRLAINTWSVVALSFVRDQSFESLFEEYSRDEPHIDFFLLPGNLLLAGNQWYVKNDKGMRLPVGPPDLN